MTQQIPLDGAAVAGAVDSDGLWHLGGDLAFLRSAIANVVFVGAPGRPGWVLVDTGLPGLGRQIEKAAERRFDGHPPAAIVLTHGHFDHVGAVQRLVAEWRVPVYAHALERPYLDGSAAYPEPDPKVSGGMMAMLSPLYPRGPVSLGEALRDLPAEGALPPLPGWRWLHTPGHAVGHVSLWREGDRTLISGDAVVTVAAEEAYATAVQATEMHGPPKYLTHDWVAAKASARALAALAPELLIPGHGRAVAGSAMRQALHELAERFGAVAIPADGKFTRQPQHAVDATAYREP